MSKNVLMIGSWHLGSVVGACVADSGNKVYLWDQSSKIAEKWSKGEAPIHEPGLEDLVKKYWGTQLFWAGQTQSATAQKGLAQAAPKADWVIVAYDTPVNDKDEIVFDVVEEGFNALMSAGFSDKAHFFFTAQLPVGTSRRFLSKIKEINPHWNGYVFYMPENLRLGEALKSFKTPDRMVVGVHVADQAGREAGVKLFRELIRDEKTLINIMSLESAEMVKHALNAFLATCVVFANEVAEICEGKGADAWDVMGSLKQDSRVGPKAFLRPGLGFSGGTLARDVKTLSKFSSQKGEHNYFSTLYRVNTERNDWIAEQLNSRLKNLKDKKIMLLGVTYKPQTSTVRRSPALEIGTLLQGLGAQCWALDPMADLDELTAQERDSLPFKMASKSQKKSGDGSWSRSFDLSVFKNMDAAVVVTEWPEFNELDFDKIKENMKQALIIDTKNLFAKSALAGRFEVVVPGKPQRK